MLKFKETFQWKHSSGPEEMFFRPTRYQVVVQGLQLNNGSICGSGMETALSAISKDRLLRRTVVQNSGTSVI